MTYASLTFSKLMRINLKSHLKKVTRSHGRRTLRNDDLKVYETMVIVLSYLITQFHYQDGEVPNTRNAVELKVTHDLTSLIHKTFQVMMNLRTSLKICDQRSTKAKRLN